ncbi:TPA: DUF3016 domain-containing protein [Stenotrophomonas maltophilia]|uniref:DUF3016 domain-containing protein n=1 Tax=Stenotrophomonas maltophilia TaxID=40324 RepID=A0AAI9C7H7_STEMA|nr:MULTISPECIES: DUF3016 domain-containing protein [Stenotrophomonas]EKT4439730.1 DUF3016 domain-containing protein [Stenotrophomonas maltophilia]KRG51303.1 hypothetical protein ARC02_01460 [Stenotrophomonas maltophilia]MBN5011643.1 DUF3016 domain-containing protein [Stenotrophomonas maltophilia]MCI1130407.1 DUF3016 domain-containing protein [Stenotrophomonas maltophilia]MCI1151519.1 DUF3016 domain-containing protein [Stenotrophomonas maltophilia]
MKRSLAIALLAGALVAGGASAAPRTVTDADAPRALQADGPVSVKWEDPAKFTEIRQSTNRFEAERGDWVQQLARYLQTTAAKPLQPGQTLDVTLVDIKRAGDYEPWHGPRGRDIRIMRDIYPPRISLQYTLKDASGRIVSEGDARLSDTGYLHNLGLRSDSDPLRYEKRLIDDWVKRQLASQATAAR